MTSYENFRKSLKNLEIQHENLKNLDAALPTLIKEGISESTIKRFEICYDVAWKSLKKHLREELAVPDVPDNPKAVFRHASENGLFSSPVDAWFGYAKARNETVHIYDGEMAKAVLSTIEHFTEDAIGLYQTLTGETWE